MNKREYIKEWHKKNPNKNKEYQIKKRIRKALREGKEPDIRAYINNCIDCGANIENRPSHAKLCKNCAWHRKNEADIRRWKIWKKQIIINPL